MTNRAQQKDTDADRELYGCLNASPPRSFMMTAGAGSGKTTSLIKGLTEVLNKQGERLRLRRQKVACITYTDVAAREIWAELGNAPLVHVSTIHSFFWSLIRSFQADIQEWVASRINEKIAKAEIAAANFGPRVHQRTRDKNQNDIARYKQQQARISRIRSFTYGTGSNYLNGILGHDDIKKMVPQIIIERPLMRTLVAQQYPFLFVDESQDTMENVVDALKAVVMEEGNQFCLGFFGDPMQSIYPTGIGAIPAAPGWVNITKRENFRCPATVLGVANAIRRDADGLVQTRGRMTGPKDAPVSMLGSAHIFVLPIDDRRDQWVAQVRAWAARTNDDPSWNRDEDNQAVKILLIVHRMAAKRLGFGDLYAALNDEAPKKFKNGFLDGTAWPVRPFINFVLPLVSASKKSHEFEVMQILRSQSPLLNRENLHGIDVADLLDELQRFTEILQQMMEPGSVATNADVLRHMQQFKVIPLDQRVLVYLDLPAQEAEKDDDVDIAEDEDDAEELTKEVSAMEAFLKCPAPQFWGYYKYVNDDSPFSTHQGVKGAEFERVLVVLDDEEGTHVQFSYDKYLGIRPLSERDEENRRAGKETIVERTRRLFYVCCTRALKDLVVVLFTADVAVAQSRIAELGLFPVDAIHGENDLATN